MSALSSIQPRGAEPRQAEHQRHLEIASTRTQKRARPRAFYAFVTIVGLVAILLGQLLLSIVVSDGAYQITALQQQQKELTRDEQSLTEQLHVLESPQHLAANAEELGMVANTSTAYLRLADGTVLGTPLPASASSGILRGTDGGPLISNELLTGVPLTPVSSATPITTAPTPGTLTPSTRTPVTPGAPGSPPATGSVASTGAALPSPITR